MSTHIEWTEEVWNPVTGCSKVSLGCTHCYAERTAATRLKDHARYAGTVRNGQWTGAVNLHDDKLDEPLGWREPRLIFVGSMSDLFHEDVPYEFVARVFTTMAQANQHTYQILSKRPRRLLGFYLWNYMQHGRWRMHPDNAAKDWLDIWPHVWFGTSVEDQAAMDTRWTYLRMVPAVVRWLSVEPMLERVRLNLRDIHWVVFGGESGPGARECDIEWIRDGVRQCRAAGVPPYVKQLGSRVTAKYEMNTAWARTIRHKKGADPAEWPQEMNVREYPQRAAG